MFGLQDFRIIEFVMSRILWFISDISVGTR
jgi:hypothetical protein